MIKNFMADKLIITFDEYTKIVEKLAIQIHKDYKPTVLVGIMRGAAPILDILSRILKIKGTVNAISGLGYNFTSDRKGLVQSFMVKLLKFGFHQDNLSIIFQNKDDFEEVKSLGVLTEYNKINFIKGSGVDLKKFNHSESIETGKIKILLPVRMLWDKGVDELRKASEILKEKYTNKILFILSGLADIENKAGVTEEYLKLKILIVLILNCLKQF